MRTQVNKPVAEYRVVKRYHKLYTQLIDLIEGVEELLPKGMELDDVVELTQLEGSIRIGYKARPVSVGIRNGQQAFVLQILESKNLKSAYKPIKKAKTPAKSEQLVEQDAEQSDVDMYDTEAYKP
jgi:hypothetical protein